MSKGIVWGSDLYKGMKVNTPNIYNLNDVLPYQMLNQEEKTVEWLHSIADHYESIGWNNVEKKSIKIQRNYWLRHGKLNPSDYIINPTENEYYEAVQIILPESSNPLQQFYPIIPNIVDVLRGEFLKRNTSFQIKQIDPSAVSEALAMKEGDFANILQQLVATEKQYELQKQGFVPQTPEMVQQYQQEIQAAVQQFNNTEAKFKTFRTTGAKWAEKVIKIQEEKYSLPELEVEGFEGGLIADREFWHLDMGEDDFKLELINNKYADFHKGPNVKYVSDGNYFLWFDWMSTGDLINTFGKRITEEDFAKLKNIYSKVVGSLVVPDYQKSIQGGYYDQTKNWHEATALNPALNDALLGKELAYNFSRSPNFDHNQDADIFSGIGGNRFNGEPQMFRVMRLYWRSLKKIGWLTKIGRDGSVEYLDWVTEDFKVSIQPKYDNSIRKDKTSENLIYGEHVDWTWVNDWRHIVKISPNQKHSFWLNNDQFDSIYIDGSSCKFQFKGKNNPYESKPPVEGCEYTYINSGTHSLVDRLKPFQILHNVAMNNVPKNFLNDYGNKLLIDRRSLNTFSAGLEEGVDPINAYADKLRNSDVLDYGVSREMMEQQGQAGLPQVLSFSTADFAMKNLQIAQYLKDLAGEVVGVNKQRQGQSKASQTAFGVQQDITYSETQTEKYFDQHFKLMEKVRQRMLDAAQYYSTFKDVSREMYMNEKEENVFLEMVGMENLLPHYNLILKSTANMRSVMQQLTKFMLEENTLPFKPSEKLEAIASESVNQMLNAVKKAESEALQQEEIKHKRDIEMEEEKRKTIMARQDAINQQQDKTEYNSNETQRDVATIRALGGVQTDVNTNAMPDAKENLDNFFKQQEMENKKGTEKDRIALDKQKHLDNMMLQRETNQNKLEETKLKTEAALKVAKENKNKYNK